MKRVIVVLFATVFCIMLFACANGIANDPLDAQTGATESPDTQDEPTTVEPATPEPTPEPPPPAEPDDIDAGPDEPALATGEVVISFEYTRQTGPASNQHAVWIEDMDGNLITSLFASRWTAEGGFATRPDSIAIWAERAGLVEMSSDDVDAVAGATPRSGMQHYIWYLTDLNGDTVTQGEYMFFVEGTLRWKNYVLYSGVITVGDNPSTSQGNALLHHEGSDRYDALTLDSIENNMIGPVTATFTP